MSTDRNIEGSNEEPSLPGGSESSAFESLLRQVARVPGAPDLSPIVELVPGAVVADRFELVREIGRGGFARVFEARDRILSRPVAIKLLKRRRSVNDSELELFYREARATARLNHPHIVTAHDWGAWNGMPFLVLELLDGESLEKLLSRGLLDERRAWEVVAQITEALAYAHAHGVLHLDLKTQNVFVLPDGWVKVLDFGLAGLDLAEHVPGRPVRVAGGTPGTMAPEQVERAPTDARTDLWAVGIILFQLLFGRLPEKLAPAAERVALPSGASSRAQRVLSRTLCRAPSDRYPDAVALLADAVVRPSGTRRARMLGGLGLVLTGIAVVAGLWRIGVFGARHDQTSMSAEVIPELHRLADSNQLAEEAQRMAMKADVEQVTFRWGKTTAARFLPNGRIVFSAAFEDRTEELFVRPSGSPSAQALGVQDAHLLAASRTGQLAIKLHPGAKRPGDWSSPGTLAEVPSIGGPPRELEESVESADWSPAGELAMVHKRGGSWVLEFPRGTILFRTKGWISDPRFSPKGDRIAFLHHPEVTDDMGEVVVTDLAGRSATLSDRWPAAAGLAWSPDGRQVWIACGHEKRNLLVSVSLEKEVREIYRSLLNLRLEDVNQGGEALVSVGVYRFELVYAGERGDSQRLLSWTAINDVVAAVSSDGKALFSAFQTSPTPKGEQQPYWVVLRSVDGSPAQVLGTGNPLDLSRDGRWALVSSLDNKTLTALPTGGGQPRAIATHGLEIFGARWIPGKPNEVLAMGRTPGVDAFRLFRLPADGSEPVLVSETPVTGWSHLQVSTDGLWAAAGTEDLRVVIISLRDGATFPVPRTPQRTTPWSWSPEGHLWVTEEDRRGATRLLRIEPHTGDVLEERTVGPADLGGASNIGTLAMTPDGKKLAFTYERSVSSLFIVRGFEQR
jgi:eukaryotic-like serine/threonine-protein kinase